MRLEGRIDDLKREAQGFRSEASGLRQIVQECERNSVRDEALIDSMSRRIRALETVVRGYHQLFEATSADAPEVDL